MELRSSIRKMQSPEVGRDATRRSNGVRKVIYCEILVDLEIYRRVTFSCVLRPCEAPTVRLRTSLTPVASPHIWSLLITIFPNTYKNETLAALSSHHPLHTHSNQPFHLNTSLFQSKNHSYQHPSLHHHALPCHHLRRCAHRHDHRLSHRSRCLIGR